MASVPKAILLILALALLAGVSAVASANTENSSGDLRITTQQGAPSVSLAATANAQLRLNSPVSVTATFSEPVSGFTLADISVMNGTADGFSGSDGDVLYTFDVTPDSLAEVTVDIAAGVATDGDGDGNTAARRLSLGIPYDFDGSGRIGRAEVIAAIVDYFGSRITRAQAIAVLLLYFTTPAEPEPGSCFQSLGASAAAVTRNGSWTGNCASTHRPGHYARFYSFTLTQQTEVEINLTSSEDTYLYLLRGADANGAVVAENDDGVSDNTNSRISRTLAAGTYTIEATTYTKGATGDFTLSIVPSGTTAPPPADACEYTLTAASSTAPPGSGVSGQWTGDCASTNQPGSYARYYTFTLPEASEVTITLESDVDTFLYLLEGAGNDGTVVAKNGDIETGNTNSQVREFLDAGTYTIEATTNSPAVTGKFTLTVTVVTVTVVPTMRDKDVLVALYHATDGPNWKDAHNWLSNAPIGQWYGVTTDSSGRVTELHLHENELSGRIPREVGDLSSLRQLLLHRNRLTGNMPSELGRLSNLEELVLTSNQLTGQIPAELVNLSNPGEAGSHQQPVDRTNTILVSQPL